MWVNLLLKLNRRRVNIGGSWVNVQQSKHVHSGTGGAMFRLDFADGGVCISRPVPPPWA